MAILKDFLHTKHPVSWSYMLKLLGEEGWDKKLALSNVTGVYDYDLLTKT